MALALGTVTSPISTAASCDMQALHAYTQSAAGQQESMQCFMSKCMGATSASAKKCCGLHCAITIIKGKYPACTPMYEMMVSQECSGADSTVADSMTLALGKVALPIIMAASCDMQALHAYTQSAAGQQESMQCFMSKCMGATSASAKKCCGMHCAITIIKGEYPACTPMYEMMVPSECSGSDSVTDTELATAYTLFSDKSIFSSAPADSNAAVVIACIAGGLTGAAFMVAFIRRSDARKVHQTPLLA